MAKVELRSHFKIQSMADFLAGVFKTASPTPKGAYSCSADAMVRRPYCNKK
jgi:hypothetical protein